MLKHISNQDYPIYLGSIFEELNEFILQLQPKVSNVYILVDENTHIHCISPLIPYVTVLNEAEILEINAGEKQKNLEIVNHLWQALSENNVDRQALIINLGGGVVSDLGGFMASVYKRGIRFINIPTSLLSMVDASIGGKTGIDLGSVKNQLGCFSNPEAVFVWPDFLKTLPKEELLSGFGEIIKYSLISKLHLWEEIKELDFQIIENLDDYIFKSLEIKSNIVEQDPFESGLRKTLNFGHTYGHAFESLSMMQDNQVALSHGKAVALGIVCELWHSVQRLNFPELVFEEIKEFIFQNFGYYPIQEKQVDTFIELMKKDKKNAGDQIAIVMLESIGNANYKEFITEDEIRTFLNYYMSL